MAFQEADRYPGYIFPTTLIKRVAWQLCLALAHLHDHGVCHRDVKVGGEARTHTLFLYLLRKGALPVLLGTRCCMEHPSRSSPCLLHSPETSSSTLVRAMSLRACNRTAAQLARQANHVAPHNRMPSIAMKCCHVAADSAGQQLDTGAAGELASVRLADFGEMGWARLRPEGASSSYLCCCRT